MLQPGDTYSLDRYVWTDADFDAMGWHDCRLYGMNWISDVNNRSQLALDIDYIFAWVKPEPPSEFFSFWISPATLVFHTALNLHVNMDDYVDCDILGVTNSPIPDKDKVNFGRLELRQWNLELVNGEISVLATGFTQYIRKKPVHCQRQFLSDEERGGVSFQIF